MYKYSLFKYVKSWSTWIILFVTIVIVAVIAGYLPSVFMSKAKANYQVYSKLILIVVASTTTFVAIFTSVFAGFKSATMYRDEIEDGSLLVMLSKPITRKKILLSKWLALQTTIAIYTFITALTFLITVEISDVGKNYDFSSVNGLLLSSKAIPISLLIWLVLEVLAIIFSSIGLLFSSKFSIGVSSGICIGIGVIIPITSIIGTFSSKPEYDSVATRSQFTNSLFRSKDTPVLNSDNIPAEAEGIYDSLPDLTQGTLSGLGVSTGDKDSFKWMQIFDINFQVQKLSEFASEQAVDENVRNSLNFSGAGGHVYKQSSLVKTSKNLDRTKENSQIDLFNKLIVESWAKTQMYRNLFLVKFFDFLANYDWHKPVRFGIREWTDAFNISELNNTTKSALDIKPLYPWIFNRTPFSSEVLNHFTTEELDFIKTLFATTEEADAEYKKEFNYTWKFSAIINAVAEFIGSIATDQEVYTLNKDYPDLGYPGSKYNALLITTERLLRPVDMWISASDFKEFRRKYGYKYDDEASDVQNYFKEIKGTGFLEGTILQSRYDSMGYFEATSAIKAGHEIALVKHVEYSNKYIILLIYLAIGFILLPATYLVIRKQDFR